MGERDQQKTGGVTGAEGAAVQGNAAVGKDTLVGNQPVDGQAAAGRPPTPPEFAQLDTDLVEKLWASRTVLAVKREAFKKPDAQFWDAIRSIGAADMHTLNVVTSGAKHVGVWPHLQTITGWYTYASSYAIEFLGDPLSITTNGQWGKDDPQSLVRKEHGNTAHDWYRNNSGAGNPGMHLGIDVGAGYHNVHWDPTNPMDHVGDGGWHMLGLGVTKEPKGIAIYSPMALIRHAAEIGYFGKTAEGALKHDNTPTEKFLRISSAKDSADKGNEFAKLEENASGKHDAARSTEVTNKVHAAAAAVIAIHAKGVGVAQKADDAATAELDALLAALPDALHQLWVSLETLIIFLKDESVVSECPFQTVADWESKPTWTAYDTIVHLLKARNHEP